MADSTLDGWGSALAPASTTLVAARTSGGISGRATVRQLVDAAAVYGHQYYNNFVAPGSPLAATAGFTAFTAGAISGMTWVNDATADYLRVDTAGTYHIQWTADIDLPAATTFRMGLYVNGVECVKGCTYSLTTAPGAATSQSVCGHVPVALVVNDQLSWRWIRTGAGTANLFVLSFSAHRIGA